MVCYLLKVLNLFFHLHKLLGTADKDLIPPPGLQLNENDIIESSTIYSFAHMLGSVSMLCDYLLFIRWF